MKEDSILEARGSRNIEKGRSEDSQECCSKKKNNKSDVNDSSPFGKKSEKLFFLPMGLPFTHFLILHSFQWEASLPPTKLCQTFGCVGHARTYCHFFQLQNKIKFLNQSEVLITFFQVARIGRLFVFAVKTMAYRPICFFLMLSTFKTV